MRARTFLLAALACCVAFGGARSVAAPGADGPDIGVILAERPAAALADYKLFRDARGDAPSAGVTPYDLAVPLFSDYASKSRYVFMPAGAKARYAADGAFEFPVGAVLIKTFAFSGDGSGTAPRKIETRLLIRRHDGWTANTYVWNAEGTQARLQVAGAQTPVRIVQSDGVVRSITYAIPNRNQCKGCHAVDGQITPIGPTSGHFGVAPTAAGETETARWARLGLLDGAPAQITAAPPSLDARARAYLDINCAHCHNPRGPANTSGLDLRATQADPSHWGIRKRPIAAGRASADLSFAIDPGHPESSILLHRMESDDPGVMMPELGRTLVHDEGVELVRAWIAQMDADGRPRQD